MKKDKTMLVVYIATGLYKSQFLGFLRSLKMLCPELKKHVIAYTDDPSHFMKYNYPHATVGTELIWHQPWPIPTLLKFHYIKHALMKYPSDYVFYFNANTRFNREISTDEFIVPNKLTVTEHWGWTTYGNQSVKELLGDVPPIEKTSGAYIPTDDYIYVNAGVVGGETEVVKNCCEWIINETDKDLKRRYIPRFDDESYLNAYVYYHPEVTNRLRSRFTYDSEKLFNLQDFDEKLPPITYACSDSTQILKNL